MVPQRCTQRTDLSPGGSIRCVAAPPTNSTFWRPSRHMHHHPRGAKRPFPKNPRWNNRFGKTNHPLTWPRSSTLTMPRSPFVNGFRKAPAPAALASMLMFVLWRFNGRPCGQKHGAHAHGSQTWQLSSDPPAVAVPQEGDSLLHVPRPLDPPPGSFELPFPGRFFVDLFAGRNAPIFHACHLLGVDLLAPLDIELGWDILLDAKTLSECSTLVGMVLWEACGPLLLAENTVAWNYNDLDQSLYELLTIPTAAWTWQLRSNCDFKPKRPSIPEVVICFMPCQQQRWLWQDGKPLQLLWHYLLKDNTDMLTRLECYLCTCSSMPLGHELLPNRGLMCANDARNSITGRLVQSCSIPLIHLLQVSRYLRHGQLPQCRATAEYPEALAMAV